MKKEIDIHNYPKKLESAIKLVKNSAISSGNKKLIIDFKDFCSLNGIGLPRMIRYLGILKDWARMLKKDFDKAKKEDIMKAVKVIQENERYSAWTKATYKIMLKRFFKWLLLSCSIFVLLSCSVFCFTIASILCFIALSFC